MIYMNWGSQTLPQYYDLEPDTYQLPEKTSVGEQHITIVIDKTIYLVNFLQGIFLEDLFVIVSIICTSQYDLLRLGESPFLFLKTCLRRVNRKDVRNKLIVWMIQINQVTETTNQNVLNLIRSNTVIKLNTRGHLHLEADTPARSLHAHRP